ncbi:thiamine diphosphokinase [Lactobacillus bombicola]|uniref:Thiamine diphosphokinase n=1 Tax=Lactobacillus bombicola TaxID=1505723 RepID=A0ABX9LV78_9LACO|nr:thiamine diphosphokinase [Lactobacillus bombicola]RHW52786.1 thiamine diphosphokinase [Lactobacillus bombicola]
MKAVALLGGPKSQWPAFMKKQIFAAKKRDSLLIGVDRGSILLAELGLVPDLAVGDFDSLKKNELNIIEQYIPDMRYSVPEKDLTDTELMLKYAFEDYQINFLTLLGATGGRLDHFMTNMLMMLKPEFNAWAEKIEIIDQQNLVKFYNPGNHTIKRRPGYTYFGIVTLSEVKNLNINGAKYNLSSYFNSYPISLSSNEFVQHNLVNVSFNEGVVAVIQSKDINRFQKI